MSSASSLDYLTTAIFNMFPLSKKATTNVMTICNQLLKVGRLTKNIIEISVVWLSKAI